RRVDIAGPLLIAIDAEHPFSLGQKAQSGAGGADVRRQQLGAVAEPRLDRDTVLEAAARRLVERGEPDAEPGQRDAEDFPVAEMEADANDGPLGCPRGKQ